MNWWRKAANQGHPSAQYNLGLMYLGREKIAVDRVQAYLWFDLAATTYGSRIAQGAVIGEARDEAISMRNEVSRMMTYQQRKEAERLVREWLEAHPQ